MNNTKMSWKRMRFKQNKVWMAVGPDGSPVLKNDKVLIKYQLKQDYEYWVNLTGVSPIHPLQTERSETTRQDPILKTVASKKMEKALTQNYQKALNSNAVCIFTDGASSGNPGPSGIGIVFRFGTHQKEISKHIGVTTNNIAELEAIKTGLLELTKTDLPVRVFTDSNYAYGVLALGWKAKKNQRLIQSIKELIAKFNDLKFISIRGHSGIEENDRADFLATSATQSGYHKNDLIG